MDQIQAFDFSVDLLQALLWQYNEAPNLEGLLTRKQEWYDVNQSAFWDDWYRDVFDLRTANDFGLSVWAIILDQRLYATYTPDTSKRIFGFDTTTRGSFSRAFSSAFKVAGSGIQYFTNFFDGTFGSTTPGVQGLSIDQRRLILRLRYFNLTMRPSVPQINAFLKDVFASEGEVYVLDGLDMTAVYIFTYQPSASLRFVLNNFDILPRPAGVEIRTLVVTRKVWGFGEYNANFADGNFGA